MSGDSGHLASDSPNDINKLHGTPTISHSPICSHDNPATISHDPTNESHDPRISPHTKSHDLYSPDNPEDALSKLYSDDSIGDTVFSKAWVLSILVEIVKTVHFDQESAYTHCSESASVSGVDKPHIHAEIEGVRFENDNGCSADSTIVPSGHQYTGGEIDKGDGCDINDSGQICFVDCDNGVVELDELLESKLCNIWDASMNEDVAKYIHEQEGVDLLLGAAGRSNMPRLTEICLGIIGNTVCSRKICMESITTKQEVVAVLQFLQYTDSGVLCQATRLVHACLSHEDVHPLWLPEIVHSKSVREALLFILKGSTNDDLLASTSELLDLLVNSSDHLLKLWTDSLMMEALCEAAQQSSQSNFQVTCTLIATLHTMTTIQEGIACVLSCGQTISAILCDFFLTVDHLDNYSICVTALTAACSIQLTLIDNVSHSNIQKTECIDPRVLQTLTSLKKKLIASKYSDIVGLISKIGQRTQNN